MTLYQNEMEADLRRRILSLELPPGRPLSRPELLREYGVSSTPLRDALIQLQSDGLVVVQPQSGTMVSLIDLEQARQAHFLRSATERAIVAELAVSAPSGLIACLDGIISLQEQHAAADLAIFAALDSRFHEELFKAANMMAVHAVIRRESMHIDRIRALHLPVGDKTMQILSDHRQIVDRIKAQDVAGAVAAMARHLSQSIAIAPELRSRMPEYFSQAPKSAPHGSH
ncbi:MAG: GntR family transcriptional regulator [Paracoccus sp. (in: a-proteobacteria)]|uniref:GntR family transcriptional regulator n=1 Tax=Paracoccus sp. TaxID=267 RepID=UPI0026E0CC91|nr:GntR family transcriptional regulator [Paracoccus sp. (in: a-proteobacteria)]MDO5612528.1 GntR family transcriptional regulator [Paracoccus sp. (in: a-proteobacteria)]